MLSKYIFIPADYAPNALERRFFSCLMGYASVLSNSNKRKSLCIIASVKQTNYVLSSAT